MRFGITGGLSAPSYSSVNKEKSRSSARPPATRGSTRYAEPGEELLYENFISARRQLLYRLIFQILSTKRPKRGKRRRTGEGLTNDQRTTPLAPLAVPRNFFSAREQ